MLTMLYSQEGMYMGDSPASSLAHEKTKTNGFAKSQQPIRRQFPISSPPTCLFPFLFPPSGIFGVLLTSISGIGRNDENEGKESTKHQHIKVGQKERGGNTRRRCISVPLPPSHFTFTQMLLHKQENTFYTRHAPPTPPPSYIRSHSFSSFLKPPSLHIFPHARKKKFFF